MRQFQIFRYIKNLRYVIILITLLGSFAIYMYAKKNQSYTAETIIKYTNTSAQDGMAPDGSKIDPNEIYSASVITDVISDLGLSINVDQIRSGCTVTEMISPEEQTRKEAVLANGEAYTQFIPVYKVTYKAGSSTNKNYVRNVLDSIINNYYLFYGEKYVDDSVIPNNTLNVSVEKYDYINCVELLDKSIDEIMEYLRKKKSLYPNFRAASTGYSFEDIEERYDYIKETCIPEYYAMVFGQKMTKNEDELIKNYQNRLVNADLLIENLGDHIQKQRELVDQFGDKVTKAESSIAGAIGDNTDAIIQSVRDAESTNVHNPETTYDNLIKTYVSLCSDDNKTRIERDYCNKVLSIFNDPSVKNDVDSENVKLLEKNLSYALEQLNSLYDILDKTANERNEYSGALNISTLTGTYVEQAINVDLYIAMAVVLFLIVGCAGAILLGRAGDFWEYFLYTDKKTGTPNRVKTDTVIDEYSKNVLDENFSCIAFRLKSLQNTNQDRGRDYGDRVLKDFGKILMDCLGKYGFVGYNNGEMFITLFDNCSLSRAENYVENVIKEIEKSTDDDSESKISFEYGISESSHDNTYEIRHILQLAIKRLNERMKNSSDEKKIEE